MKWEKKELLYLWKPQHGPHKVVMAIYWDFRHDSANHTKKLEDLFWIAPICYHVVYANAWSLYSNKCRQNLSEALDNQDQADVICTDLSTAFNRLQYEILLWQLNRCSFSLPMLSLLYFYLYDRHQYVCFRGSSSRSFSVLSGVPRGSVLGPLLSNIFINNLVSCLNVPLLLCADDIKIYFRTALISRKISVDLAFGVNRIGYH